MKIDINCDVGEGVTNESLLFPYISSCNIACGGHFGDEKSIDNTIKLAIKHNVLIGAHPSFPDKENFGRKLMNITNEVLEKSIQDQLNLFFKRLANFKVKLHHIKPHGALYNLIALDEVAAENFVRTIKRYLNDVYLYVPYNSVIEKVALKNNINIKYEVFIDRNYNDDYTLVSRSEKNAIKTDSKEIMNQLYKIILDEKIKVISGEEKRIKADTFCIHGDHPNSLEILKYLTKELSKKSIDF